MKKNNFDAEGLKFQKRFLRSVASSKNNLSQMVKDTSLSKQEQDASIKDTCKQIRAQVEKIKIAEKNNTPLTVEFQQIFWYENDPVPYTVRVRNGQVITDYLIKSFYNITFKDCQFMKSGTLHHPKDKYTQSLVAVCLTFFLVYESILGKVSDYNKTIADAHLELINFIIETDDYKLYKLDKSSFLQNHTPESLPISLFFYLFINKLIESFRRLSAARLYLHLAPQQLSKHEEFLEHLRSELISLHIPPWIIEDIPKSKQKSELKEIIMEEFAYIYKVLREIINRLIDKGFLKEYQQPDADGKFPIICSNNTLLNNKKLLSRLHVNKLGKVGNQKKQEYYQEYKDFVVELIFKNDQVHQKKYSSLSLAALAIAERHGKEIEDYINSRMEYHQHQVNIKFENYPQNIENWLKSHKEIKKIKKILLNI